MKPRSLSPLERDALREVANIGAGHAATALSEMTGGRIMINVPEVILIQVERLPDVVGSLETPVAAVRMRVMGDFTGTTVLVSPEDSAQALCRLLLHRDREPKGLDFDSMEQSTLKETGNILCSAYLTALSDFLGMMLLPSVPELAVGQAGTVLSPPVLRAESAGDPVFCVETAFRIEGSERSYTALFLLLPDPAALDVIFDAIKIAS
ncbi:MAG TPA: chemotaxis protein CheC [Gemmatimonadales bacterium]|nr:chemotaxis protein CheC [Gemmatimonadales bacterium]